jgi:hypothetical protein
LLRETQPRHPMNEDMSLSTLLASDILRANSAWLASMRCARGWRGGGVAPKSAPPARVGSQRAIAPNQRAIAPNQAHSGARAQSPPSDVAASPSRAAWRRPYLSSPPRFAGCACAHLRQPPPCTRSHFHRDRYSHRSDPFGSDYSWWPCLRCTYQRWPRAVRDGS